MNLHLLLPVAALLVCLVSGTLGAVAFRASSPPARTRRAAQPRARHRRNPYAASTVAIGG